MLYAFRPRHIFTIAAAAMLFTFGCTAAPTNTNTTATGNANTANTNASASTTGTGSIPVGEPADYSAKMTITTQTTGDASKVQVPPLQFDFAKRGGDRRWSFTLPAPVGQVMYLEKSGIKYLIVPARKQYVELSPEALGFSLPSLMTPVAIVDQLKARTQYKDLGVETVNGRPANKYSFAGSVDTRTQVGTAQTESVVYVDQSTKLPLRAEINTSTTSGAGMRIMTVTEDIQLNPDPALFDVPAGYRKVTSEELKQQVQNFVAALRVFVNIMREQQSGGAAPATAPPAQPTANANRPAANANR